MNKTMRDQCWLIFKGFTRCAKSSASALGDTEGTCWGAIRMVQVKTGRSVSQEERVLLDLEPPTGLPVRLNTESCEFLRPTRALTLRRCAPGLPTSVAPCGPERRVEGGDRVIYALYLAACGSRRTPGSVEEARVGYGIVGLSARASSPASM